MYLFMLVFMASVKKQERKKERIPEREMPVTSPPVGERCRICAVNTHVEI